MVESDFLNATDNVASAVAANSNIFGRKHIETGPDLTTTPVDQLSTPFSKSSEENGRGSRKGIVIAMMLGLAIGIAIGGEWSPQTFTENLKAINLRGVAETIFAGSSNGEPSAQLPLQASAATDTRLSEIADQLIAVTGDLSFMKQNIQELTTGQEQIRKSQEQLAQSQSAGQEQIRKVQEQLAQMQSRFSALQAQANLKQHPQQPSPPPPDSRRPNRLR